MDRRKNSRSQPRPELNVRLISATVTPAFSSAQDQNTSFYEIDIQSSVEYGDRPINKMWEETKNVGKCNILGNPFIESYYPTVNKPQPEINRISLTKKIDSNVQTDLNIQVEPEKKTKKQNKENQTPSLESSRKFRQQMKNYIIERFISKNDSKMKALFENLSEKSENDQLHIHHHEHHHHYYLNDNKECLSVTQDTQKINSPMERKYSKDQVYNKRSREFVSDEPKPTYYFNWSKASNQTFTKAPAYSSKTQAIDSEESPKFDTRLLNRSKEKKCLESSRSKFSNSLESILTKRSDFITSHIYSDSELTKCNSEETNVTKTTSMPSLNDATSFDDRAIPVLRITNVVSSSSVVEKANDGLVMTYGKEDLKEQTDNSAQKGKIQSALPFTSLQSKNSSANESYYRTWTAKLKTELKEIKKELRRIEKRHLEKKKSFTFLLNDSDEKADGESNHRIFVYSSKTFIVTPKDMYANKKHNYQEVKSLFRKRKGEEKCRFQKEDALDSKKVYLKERSICRQQQVYLVPNKFYN